MKQARIERGRTCLSGRHILLRTEIYAAHLSRGIAAAAIDRYLLRPTSAANAPPLLSIDGTDRLTDGHSTVLLTLAAYYA